MRETERLNIEYFSLQSLFWMTYCMVAGFAVTYLLSCGYTNTETGYILASANVFALILQPVMADVADRSKRVNALVILLAAVIVIFMCGLQLLFISTRSLVMTIVYTIMITLANASIAFLTSVQFLMDPAGDKINFGLCRAGGSLFYALLSSLIGVLFERISRLSVPTALCILCFLMIILLLYILRYRIRGREKTKHFDHFEASHSLIDFCKMNRKFMILSASMIFIYYAHAFMNNYVIGIVKSVGGNNSDMGYLIAFMALMELPCMLFFRKISRYFMISSLLIFSLMMFTIKAILVLIAPSLGVVYVGFGIQALSFAIYIPASVQYANMTVSKVDTVKAQMMFNFMQTVGTVFSSVCGGRLIDLSGMHTALLVSAVLSAIGSVIALFGIEKEKVRISCNS